MSKTFILSLMAIAGVEFLVACLVGLIWGGAIGYVFLQGELFLSTLLFVALLVACYESEKEAGNYE